MRKKQRQQGIHTALALLVLAPSIAWSATPEWLRAQVGLPVPAHEEATDAILMYSETIVIVQPNGNIKKLYRNAFKILRPSGERLAMVRIPYDRQSRISALRAWSIPTQGKDFEVGEKDALETALGVTNGELVSDLRTKVLRIPAATPGSVIGYEFEQEHRPYMPVVEWDFQETIPVRESRFSLLLPAGWTHQSTWLNYPEQQATAEATGKWRWSVSNLKAVRVEEDMPPWRGIAGRMSIALQAPQGGMSGMQSWRDIGTWYTGLTRDRREPTPEIKRHVAELTAAAATPLQKIQVLANFAQNDVRYVAIEIGIGGYQPHRAADVFTNRFGDCKDKVTLLTVMLKEIGIESYYVIINTERGSVGAATPPNLNFNHVVMAIAVPGDLDDTSLLAKVTHPKHGRLVFFDPTDNLTPFGRLSGSLQNNYGILVTNDGGELTALPKLPSSSNAIERTARMTLDEKGTLRGDIVEAWHGDLGAMQRYVHRTAPQIADRIKPVESVAAASFTSFEILKAAVGNLRSADKPFEWHYSVEAPGYAKLAGDLILVRARVVGGKGSGLLETKEPREHPIEFDRPQRDKDVFEIELPPGYVVEELPPPVNVDEGFAAYQSKAEFVGGKLRYTRTFEIRELSVAPAKATKLKQLYRTIANDERMVAVLKRSTT